MTAKITISIPDSLMARIKEKIKETDFKTIEDYVLYILKQMASDEVNAGKEKLAYSDEEEAALKKKLEEMGYL